MTQNEMFETPSTADVAMLDKIREVEREIGYREGVYTRMVSNGKMTREVADRRILVMQAVLADLYKLLEQENQVEAENGEGITIDIEPR